MDRAQLVKDSRGAVSVLFAGAAVPIVGLLGLAIDYSFFTQARTQMQLAADGAALNAARLAASEFVQPVTSWQTDAQTNGVDWFSMQLSALREASANTPSVSVGRSGTTFTSSVTYTGTVPTHFAKLFGYNSFGVRGAAGAQIAINAYVNITLLLDNSSSMLIGSSTADINTLQAITGCSPESMTSNQTTSAWTGPATPSSCPSTIAKVSGDSYNVSAPSAGHAPFAAPCGFACHWSQDNQTANGRPDYTQYDYYALARNPSIGPVTGYTKPMLRYDVVQSAALNVISTMNSQETSSGIANQFGVAVYTFNNSIAKVYPPLASGAEAGYDLGTDSNSAQTAVGAIVPPVVSNDGDTNFSGALNSLASTYMTAAGDGSSSASPKKALFIVTDGIQDYTPSGGSRTLGPVSDSTSIAACNRVKAMGINVYVLYTPYTPLPYNPFYVSNIATYVNNPPTPNDTIQALQNCASNPSNYYEADLPNQIATGLNALLQAAISSPVRISS